MLLNTKTFSSSRKRSFLKSFLIRVVLKVYYCAAIIFFSFFFFFFFSQPYFL